MHHARPPLRASAVRAALLLLALGGTAACRDRDTEALPTAPTLAAASATDGGAPFYYYFKEKIPLQVDPSRVVVKGGPEVVGAARAALARSGVAVLSAEPLQEDHWLLRTGAGLTTAGLRSARAELVQADRSRFMSHVYRTLDGNDLVPLDRVVVQFRRDVPETRIVALADSLGLGVLRRPIPRYGFTYWWLSYPRGADPLAVAASLTENPAVEWADPDALSNRHPAYVPSDPLYSSQWNLHNGTTYNGVPVDINVQPAWDLTLSSSSIRVAVVDLGVDVNNPDVGSALVGAYDIYPGVYAGEDAYHPCLSPCVYYYSNGSYWKTGDSHGTEVAGIIAARQNGIGVAGIAPNVQILAVRAGRNNVMGSNAQIGDAINWAWNGGFADVLNNSWGGGSASSSITNAINNAATQGRGGKGAVVVFSAGNTNGGGVTYPATLANVIAVGALGHDGNWAPYSARGPEIDVVAPSSDNIYGITTTDLVGTYGAGSGDYSYTFGGTSAAAPQVSGTAALMLSRDPSLPGSTVRERISMEADPWFANTGGGKLNARRAMDVPPLSVSISGARYVPYQYATGSCTWTAVHRGGQPPYTYVWTRDGSWVGSSETWTLSGPLYNASSNLQVTITDALGSTATATWMVVATTSSYTCY
jgi:subtilisin family serine protease